MIFCIYIYIFWDWTNFKIDHILDPLWWWFEGQKKVPVPLCFLLKNKSNKIIRIPSSLPSPCDYVSKLQFWTWFAENYTYDPCLEFSTFFVPQRIFRDPFHPWKVEWMQQCCRRQRPLQGWKRKVTKDFQQMTLTKLPLFNFLVW